MDFAPLPTRGRVADGRSLSWSTYDYGSTSDARRANSVNVERTDTTRLKFDVEWKSEDVVNNYGSVGDPEGLNSALKPEYSNINGDSEMDQDGTKVDFEALICFFFIGIGATTAYTAILSNVKWYTDMFGPQSYLYLTLGIYGPALPMVLLQGLFDSRFNNKYGQARAFLFRFLACSIILASCLVFLAIRKPRSLSEAIAVAIIVGIISGCSYGTSMQVVTIVGEPYANALFALGFQGSGLFVLVVALVSGISQHVNEGFSIPQNEVTGFFGTCALFQVFSLLAFLRLQKNPAYINVKKSVRGGDDDPQNLKLLDGKSSVESITSTIGVSHLLRKLAPVLLSLTLTIFGNIVLLPFYSYVKCSSSSRMWGEHCENISTYLFYCKVIPDALSRPSTIYLKLVRGPKTLLAMALLRSIMVIIFFVYICTDYLGEWNAWFICGYITAFSFLGGYIITTSYKMASETSNELPRQNANTIANIMNSGFQSALVGALLLATALQAFGVVSA